MSKNELVHLVLNGESYQVSVLARERNSVRFEIEGREYLVEFPQTIPLSSAHSPSIRRPLAPSRPLAQSQDSSAVHAPIPGVISEILVREGEKVEVGTLLLRLEAMKMQNGIFAEVAGVVKKIYVDASQEVLDGELLVQLEAQ